MVVWLFDIICCKYFGLFIKLIVIFIKILLIFCIVFLEEKIFIVKFCVLCYVKRMGVVFIKIYG